MSYHNAKPVQNLTFDVNSKQWLPEPRLQVGANGTLDVEIAGLPTDGNNPSLTLAYDGSNQLTTISKVIDGTTYTKTIVWLGGVITSVSSWS